MSAKPWNGQWPTVQLGDLSTSRLGKMLSPAAKAGAEEHPYLGNAEVQWGAIRLSNLRTMSFSPTERVEFKLVRGDVLICEGGEAGRTAVVEVDLPGIFFQKALHRVRCSDQLLPRFLYHYMRFASAAGALSGFSSQATIMHLTGVKLRTLPIPLPPIEEQRRIAAVLDRADELRAKRQTSLALISALTESIFRDMFGSVDQRSRIPLGTVFDVVSRCEAGKSVQTNEADVSVARHWVLKVSAVTSGSFRPLEAKPVPPDYEPPEAHYVRQGDILFSRANTEALVGAAALVVQPAPNRLLSDKLWRLVVRDGAVPEYVLAFLQMPATRERIGRLATGTSGSMKNISQKKLLAMPIPLPPVDEQRRFAERVRVVESGRGLVSAGLRGLEDLFVSLQQQAFAGQL